MLSYLSRAQQPSKLLGSVMKGPTLSTNSNTVNSSWKARISASPRQMATDGREPQNYLLGLPLVRHPGWRLRRKRDTELVLFMGDDPSSISRANTSVR
jgi:hypothetical protein